MSSELSPEQRRILDRRIGRLVWAEEPGFHTLDPQHPEVQPPSFIKEGLEFPGKDVKAVVEGAFGLLVRDKEDNGFIVLPNKEIDWAVRPRIDMALATIIREGFLEKDSGFDGLFTEGCMSAGKTTFLEELGSQATESGRSVLFIRPKRAREKNGHQELVGNYPSLVNLVEVVSVDEVTVLAESPEADLVIWDEMNLLIFAPSQKFATQEEKARAIVDATERIIEKGSKFAGALLHRYATGQAFPPIMEILELHKKNPRTEIIGMHAQCICGAVADVQALTEIYHWQGKFNSGGECLVRPLVPIDEKREAIENFYGPLCQHCHFLIHGELAPPRWDKLDLSGIRTFASVDLF